MPEREATVGAAEPQRVGERRPNAHRARLPGHEVDVAVGIGFCVICVHRRDTIANRQRAHSGFNRAQASQVGLSPELLLATGLVRLGQPGNAFARADAGLARALLDDLLRSDADVTSLADRLAKLDEQLLPLFGRDGLSKAQAGLREELIRQRRESSAELVRRTAAASARQLLPLADIQEQIPREAALVLWI